MASLNRAELIGNLGADPETRFLPSGDQVTNIRLATTDRYKDRATGEIRESTEWHRVVFFGRLAGVAAQYLTKGVEIYVEGRLKTRKWSDKGVERYATEITADRLLMFGGRKPPTRGQVANQTDDEDIDLDSPPF